MQNVQHSKQNKNHDVGKTAPSASKLMVQKEIVCHFWIFLDTFSNLNKDTTILSPETYRMHYNTNSLGPSTLYA